jgi:hypothetical protein
MLNKLKYCFSWVIAALPIAFMLSVSHNLVGNNTRPVSATTVLKGPTLRLVYLNDNGNWEHLCTGVAVIGDFALTAGHCVGGAVAVRVEYWYYYITSYRRVVDEGIGRDIAVFRFRPTGYSRSVVLDRPLTVGDRLLFSGYPSGLYMETVCTYLGPYVSNDDVVRYAGRAECEYPLSGGASGSPLFVLGTHRAIAGILTHLDRVSIANPRSKYVLFTMFPEANKLIKDSSTGGM